MLCPNRHLEIKWCSHTPGYYLGLIFIISGSGRVYYSHWGCLALDYDNICLHTNKLISTLVPLSMTLLVIFQSSFLNQLDFHGAWVQEILCGWYNLQDCNLSWMKQTSSWIKNILLHAIIKSVIVTQVVMTSLWMIHYAQFGKEHGPYVARSSMWICNNQVSYSPIACAPLSIRSGQNRIFSGLV